MPPAAPSARIAAIRHSILVAFGVLAAVALLAAFVLAALPLSGAAARGGEVVGDKSEAAKGDKWGTSAP